MKMKKNQSMFRVFNLTLIIIGLFCVNAAADPLFELGEVALDGGYYDTLTETWLTENPNFELVLDMNKSKGIAQVFAVTLVIAVSETNGNMDEGSISLDGGLTEVSNSAFQWGIPSVVHNGKTYTLPTHDVYPAWYANVTVSDGGTIVLPSQEIYDVVVEGFSWVHFDAFGFYKKSTSDQYAFAPFSHDAGYYDAGGSGEYVESVPEPSTFFLFLVSGLMLLVFKGVKSFLKTV